MQLSEQQVNYFRTFGFLIFRQLFSPEELARYNREFDAGLDARIPGGRHEGTERFWAPLNDADTPFITGLMDDPRFADVAEEALGKPVLAVGGDSNYYVGDTRWHPDNRDMKYEGVKFTIYLEPLNGSNGALRVIPGSHREPLHSAIAGDPNHTYTTVQGDIGEIFGVRPEDLPAYVFESTPGDVLVFNSALWHAAFGGSSHRRMGTVQFYADPDTPEATEVIQGIFRRMNPESIRRSGHPWFSDYWRQIDNPRHRRWVERLGELGAFDVPATAGAGG